MIIKQGEINTIQGDSFGQVTETKINSAKLQKLYGILSGLYKDLFGSIVRELCSNMWDAHKQAGKEDRPIMVVLDLKEGNKTISFKDEGTGMSPDVMRNIFFNYLDSTKEDSDEVIGGWGIGSKSPLAYTHTFYIDTIVDGTLYHYIFSKQANGIPAGELLFEEKTTDCNGTTVTVPIKQGDDYYNFMSAIKRQLVYFPNVYVSIIGGDSYNKFGDYYNNDYTIYDFKDFIYRPDLQSSNEMHMCIGNVYYPINWIELGISSIKIPLALKFNIGELMPTPSREDIVYSKESIKAIKDKIDTVILYLTNKCVDSMSTCKTIKEYRRACYDYNNSSIRVVLTKDVSIIVDGTYLSANVEPTIATSVGKFNKISAIFNRYIGIDYQVVNSINSSTGCKISDSYFQNNSEFGRFGYGRNANVPENSIYWERHNKSDISHDRYLLIEGPENHKKNLFVAYKRDDGYSRSICFIRYIKPSLELYKKTILQDIPKSDWREVIKEFQRLQKEYYESHLEKYDDIEIDQEWLKGEEDKRALITMEARTRRKIQAKIVYYRIERGTNAPFVSVKMEDPVKRISDSAHMVIYTTNDDRNRAVSLRNILKDIISYNLTKGKRSKAVFSVITTALSNQKTFKEYSNMIELNEFITSKHPAVAKVATAYAICEIFKGVSLSSATSGDDKLIVPDMASDSLKFKAYLDHYYSISWRNSSEHFMKDVYNLVNDAGALDYNLIEEAEKFKSMLVKYENIKRWIKSGSSYCATKEFDYYKYLTILLKHEKIPYNKTMNCKNEFNDIYKMCNPDEFKTKIDTVDD